MDIRSISQERAYRQNLWNALIAHGGPKAISAALLRDLKIYNGASGIWVDKARTGVLTTDGHGITVALVHTGNTYPDDWSEGGVIYHYPETHRPKGRDVSEIEATKHAGGHDVPVFVITHTSHSTRDVYQGWVDGWDDSSKQFLIIFGDAPSQRSSIHPEEENEVPLALFQTEKGIQQTIQRRLNQQRFKFQVFKRYGPQCAVCDLSVPALLQAAHIVPKASNGTDDPRNGLVLCANHHLAFDNGLFALHPESLEICYPSSRLNAQTLQIAHQDVSHLRCLPHRDTLVWRYQFWVKG